MKINYFEDTDTAFIEFTAQPVAETRELCENIYIDLDKHGNLVSMKIEHARAECQHPRIHLRASRKSDR